MTFISIYIILGTVCVSLLTAEPEISVSGPVGSTAVLPCELASVDTDTPYIVWNMKTETVIERLDEKSYQGERYVGRVDVPVEELRKGNCSLVLRNLTLSDTGVYVSRQGIKIDTFSLASYVVRSQVYLSVFDISPPPKNNDMEIQLSIRIPRSQLEQSSEFQCECHQSQS